MNDIMLKQSQTMTSTEIADLVELRHDNVKRTIESLIVSRAIQHPQIEDVKNDKNQTVRQFVICKRDTYVIVAQLSPAFTARLVDRWQELEEAEAGLSVSVPTTFAAALRLAAEQAEELQAKTQQLEAARPALQFVERYVDATGLKSFREVCKLLGAKEPDFRKFLDTSKIMYFLNGSWTPYADHIDAGRFIVKAGEAGNGHAFNSAKFTPKGVNWVAGKWAIYNIKAA